MSIFKETFPKFVTKQIKIREDILSSGIDPATGKHTDGSRSNDFFTYTLNKQCILRMSSGVNVLDFSKFDEENKTSTARKWVLEGGIKDNGENRGGFTSGPQSRAGAGVAYGGINIRSDAADGYGIVPMPGIIDASIRTKSAYGSLREGKVKFVCHNKRQLDILEVLYMRPGYTLLLEWQWTPHFGNDGLPTSEDYFISDFFEGTTHKKLEKDILRNKESSGGNYDALIGYCKNFNYTLRPDGGYDCETEIIAKGEVIESLKTSNDYGDRTNGAHSTPIELLLEDINALDGGVKTNNYILQTLGIEDSTTPGAYIIPKGHKMTKKDVNEPDALGFGGSGVTTHAYVRWDAFAWALNSFVPKGSEGEPLFQLSTYQIMGDEIGGDKKLEPFKYGGLNDLSKKFYNLTQIEQTWEGGTTINKIDLNYELADISTNPNVCFFNHQLYYSKNQQDKGAMDPHHQKMQNMLGKKSRHKLTTFPINASGKNYIIRNIGLTWFCVDYLKSKFRSLYYTEDGSVNEDYSLYKFIEAIWDSVNGCSEGHDFKLHTFNSPQGDLIRVIDMSLIDKEEVVNLEDVHELKILSTDSMVREVNYNTTIPSALSSTIAIAAQAPDSMSSLDAVSFAALNKGIEDRFNKKIGKSDDPSDEDKNKYIKNFEHALENMAVSIGYNASKPTNTKTLLVNNTYGIKYGYSLFYYNEIMLGAHTDDRYSIIGTYGENGLAEEPPSLTKLKISQKKLVDAMSYIQNAYGKTYGNKFRGQYAEAVSSKAAIIPLKFNAKMDGISGLVIGNIFKLPKDKLPSAYQSNHIYFIVMGEEQSITSGQDWTTTISGHLILLADPEDKTTKDHIESWKKPNLEFTNTMVWSGETSVWKQGDVVTATEDIANAAIKTGSPLSNPMAHAIKVSGGEWGERRKTSDPKVFYHHGGLDLGRDKEGNKGYGETQLLAMQDGTVTTRTGLGKDTCGGKIQIVYKIPSDFPKFEGDKFTVTYCHCSDIFVNIGDTVVTGQHVGNMGGSKDGEIARGRGTTHNDVYKYTGKTDGEHLHISINHNKTAATTYNNGPYKGGASSYTLDSTNPRDWIAIGEVRLNVDEDVVEKEIIKEVTGDQKPNYCFKIGTPIEMFDGTKKNIEDIKKGDIIKSYRNGKYTSGIITKTLSHPINDVIPVAILGDIIGSVDHPIFINNKWYEISKAPINKEITHMFIDNWYNLEVDGHVINDSDHNYIINGYIMSGLGDHEVLNNTFQRQTIYNTTTNYIVHNK